jgi:hypothetical protein
MQPSTPSSASLTPPCAYTNAQAETQRVTGTSMSPGDGTLQLNLAAPLAFLHKANFKSYPEEDLVLEARAEVAVLESNVVVTSPDAGAQNALGGEKFGAYVRVQGEQAGGTWCVDARCCCCAVDKLQALLLSRSLALAASLPGPTLAASLPGPTLAASLPGPPLAASLPGPTQAVYTLPPHWHSHPHLQHHSAPRRHLGSPALQRGLPELRPGRPQQSMHHIRRHQRPRRQQRHRQLLPAPLLRRDCL